MPHLPVKRILIISTSVVIGAIFVATVRSQHPVSSPPTSRPASGSTMNNPTDISETDNSDNNTEQSDSVYQYGGGSQSTTTTRVLSSSKSATSSPYVWKPTNRFLQTVFSTDDLQISEINYGVGNSFLNTPEDLYMTMVAPKSSADPAAVNRPVIVALTGGGETGAYCDSSYDDDLNAMELMAQMGYVTVVLRPIVATSVFCPFYESGESTGVPAENFLNNIANNLNAANIAISYLHSNSSLLGINADRIGMYGYSIGGTTSLLKTRSMFENGLPVRAIAAFSSFAPTSMLGPYSPPSDTGPPNLLMISFEDDGGFVGVTPDAQADCADFTIGGYPCIYGDIVGHGHPLHPDDTTLPVTVNGGAPNTVRNIFTQFMYANLVN